MRFSGGPRDAISAGARGTTRTLPEAPTGIEPVYTALQAAA
jgi:hypothetical protein